MKPYRLIILGIMAALFTGRAHAQDDKKALSSGSAFATIADSTQKHTGTDTVKPAASNTKRDSVPKHDPRKATLRSALIPGWGQAYNKEYWKIPIVYGIISIPTVLYFYNNSYYKKTKFAYEARVKAEINAKDTADLALIDPEIRGLSTASLQTYRNSFRQSRDYSILWFLLAWGLQVADATVFAHLKQFDVSKDLSMELTPTFSPATRTPGLGLTLNLKSPPRKSTVVTR